jgi:DNA-binding response OmpR family regulator
LTRLFSYNKTTTHEGDLKNMTNILIAEDDLEIGLFWESWLGEMGYAVTRSTNKADTLGAFNPGFYALVVLDIQMPPARGEKTINIKAGLEAAEEMRKLDPAVPVLFLTGSGDEEIEPDALQLSGKGEKDFVRKPCGKKAFQLRVQRMLLEDRFPFGPRAFIDTNTRTATIIGEEEPRHLPPQVFDLAVVFSQNPNTRLPRERLIALWGWGEGSLDESVSRLREAVGDKARTTIKNIHGAGYIYPAYNGTPPVMPFMVFARRRGDY